MRPGRHAAEDGSFRRSAGVAVGRAAVLLLVAVVLGIFLLNKVDDEGGTTVSQTSDVTEPVEDVVTPTTLPAPSTTVRTAKDPATVKVLAVNGTTTTGIGARTKEVMLAAKYNTLTPTDAKTKPAKTTTFYYKPGLDADAAAVAALFQMPPSQTKPLPADAANLVKETRNLANADIVVIAGEDIIPKLPPPSATTTTAKPAGTTTTTARPATTTTAKP
jgi:LytR cell envelope-related transcriptional attenuator